MSVDDSELTEKEAELLRELEEFKKEKERVRNLLGSIGGKNQSSREKLINMAFLAIILVFFMLELTTHFLPSYISLEIGVLLVSLKIIMLINSASKANHFSFWILNSIEFRVNEINKRTIQMEKEIRKLKNENP